MYDFVFIVVICKTDLILKNNITNYREWQHKHMEKKLVKAKNDGNGYGSCSDTGNSNSNCIQ